MPHLIDRRGMALLVAAWACVASAQSLFPQLQPSLADERKVRWEGEAFVDAEASLFVQVDNGRAQACRRSDGTEREDAVQAHSLAAHLSGIGAWALEFQPNGATGFTDFALYRLRCDAAPVKTVLVADQAWAPGFGVDFAVDEAGKACVLAEAGLLCASAAGGTLALEVPVSQLTARLPPTAEVVAESGGVLPDGATFDGLELTSLVRSGRTARWFITAQLRFRHPLGAVLSERARVLFEVSAAGARVVAGPSANPFNPAANLETLSLDEPRGLVFVSSGRPNASPTFFGANGERTRRGPSQAVFAADGHGLGALDWQRAWDFLVADLAVGAPRPRFVRAFTGAFVARVSNNPGVTPGQSVWKLAVDDERVDFDLDGLDAARERALGTDPLVGDTDDGGTWDGVEVARGSDPRSPTDDEPTRGQLPDGVEFVQSLLLEERSEVVTLRHPFLPGKRFCGDAACAAKLRERLGALSDPVLSRAGTSVFGFDGAALVERRFDGTSRTVTTLEAKTLIIPVTGALWVGTPSGLRIFRDDGTTEDVDFLQLACGGPCGENEQGNSMDIIGQTADEALLLRFFGNDELLLFKWHPARGLRLLGRNRLMPDVGGGTVGQLTGCVFSSDGVCLGAYLVSGGRSFPYQVSGRSFEAHQAMRMLTNGNPSWPLTVDRFGGYAFLDTGMTVESRWVRMEDRVEPGDVLTMEGFGDATRPLRMYRIGPEGGTLALFGDVWDPAPTAGQNPTRFPGVPFARGLGASSGGRLCLVGTDGTYWEFRAPDAQGRPTQVGQVTGLTGAVDCEFDATGVAHVLVSQPPQLVLVDTRLAGDPITRRIALDATGVPTHVQVRADGVDLVSRGPAPIACVTVASGEVKAGQVQAVASTTAPDGTGWFIDAAFIAVRRASGDACGAASVQLEGQLQVGPAAFYDLVARPDGRLVALGSRQLIVTPGGSAVDTMVQSRVLLGPLAVVPGGTWTDPWGPAEQPDFSSSAPSDGGVGTPGTPGKACGCTSAPMLLSLLALSLLRRRATSPCAAGRGRSERSG